ncbi:hypothetical protein CANCADRAFT_55487 [Tortispora caseinolytica NRRL Y-17796]|uniref:RRM domain-containing protein n=1 Tax=Tortispora caseinolytica NRRL Y-17796 TaxID=767744 RepID=A0A1E4TIS4_9ASCO|nr:hypothetical protein CANCADRAFT_55487 [Tortispora caseinolytica NRRL Y-17796]
MSAFPPPGLRASLPAQELPVLHTAGLSKNALISPTTTESPRSAFQSSTFTTSRYYDVFSTDSSRPKAAVAMSSTANHNADSDTAANIDAKPEAPYVLRIVNVPPTVSVAELTLMFTFARDFHSCRLASDTPISSDSSSGSDSPSYPAAMAYFRTYQAALEAHSIIDGRADIFHFHASPSSLPLACDLICTPTQQYTVKPASHHSSFSSAPSSAFLSSDGSFHGQQLHSATPSLFTDMNTQEHSVPVKPVSGGRPLRSADISSANTERSSYFSPLRTSPQDSLCSLDSISQIKRVSNDTDSIDNESDMRHKDTSSWPNLELRMPPPPKRFSSMPAVSNGSFRQASSLTSPGLPTPHHFPFASPISPSGSLPPSSPFAVTFPRKADGSQTNSTSATIQEHPTGVAAARAVENLSISQQSQNQVQSQNQTQHSFQSQAQLHPHPKPGTSQKPAASNPSSVILPTGASAVSTATTIEDLQAGGRLVPPINPADQNPPCNTLYVGNLPMNASEDELRELFSKQEGYKRLSFRVRSNGPMCFVEFENVVYATQSLNELYGKGLSNSVKGGIRLSFSKNPLGVRSTGNGSVNKPGANYSAQSTPQSNLGDPAFKARKYPGVQDSDFAMNHGHVDYTTVAK